MALITEIERSLGGWQVGGKAALVTDIGVVAPASFSPFFRVWKISAPMRRRTSGEGRRADQHHHEFLEVDGVYIWHACHH